MKYIPTIGLEIHAELKTTTKMFCNSKNDPDEKRPNINICPICMAHPGTLPTINKDAVKKVIQVGLAIDGTIADYSEFDRKNYFYPDIPKAYQLSQYEFPLVSGGKINGVAITRIHLEEDTARSSHTTHEDDSYVDFNRAGVPLMELVTEPEIHTAEQAGAFGRELQLLLRTLKVSDAHMQKGEMRVEVNISLSKGNQLGTKVEIKNLNSFRAVERSIAFEIERQTELLEKGEGIVQETRGWDENKGITFSQRVKEEAADYRYFPDPDLPKMKISEIPEFDREILLQSMPELPNAKRERLKNEFALPDGAVEIYVHDTELYDLFAGTVNEIKGDDALTGDMHKVTSLVSNYVINNVSALRQENADESEGGAGSESPVTDAIDDKEDKDVDQNTQNTADIRRITPKALKDIVLLAHSGDISSNGAVELIGLVLNGTHFDEIRTLADEKGLLQDNDEETLNALVEGILSENEDVVEEYKGGKTQLLQFLVGQGMKKSKGSANPAKIKELLIQKIG